MAIARPFAYNTGDTITDMFQSGDLAIGPLTGSTHRYDLQYGSVKWYMGADEELGYIIGDSVDQTKKPTFLRSAHNDVDYLKLANYINKKEGGQGVFNDMNLAKAWMEGDGYWTSFSGDTNMLTGWTNSSATPFDSFTSYGRSSFRIVSDGVEPVSRAFCNPREVIGYDWDPGPPPQWGSSMMTVNITWNSGTATVYLQLYYGTSQQSQTWREYGGGNTLNSGNIIVPTESNVNYAITTLDACDITITNAWWNITDGDPG